jgi:hypothetical protein
VRPERLSASVQKLQSMGRSPGLENCRFHYSRSSQQQSQHSGATARDSHPFPYSPHFLGHPDAFNYKEQFLSSLGLARTLSRVPWHCQTRLLPSAGVVQSTSFSCCWGKQQPKGWTLNLCFANRCPVRFIRFSNSREPPSRNDQNHRMDG